MKQSDYRREQKKLRKIQIAITISGIIISIVLLVGIVQNIAKQNYYNCFIKLTGDLQ